MAAVAVAMFDLVENIGVGGIETMSAGRPRPVEVGEAGCMMKALKLAEVYWKRKQMCHRLVGGRRRMSQLRWREMLRSVGRD